MRARALLLLLPSMSLLGCGAAPSAPCVDKTVFSLQPAAAALSSSAAAPANQTQFVASVALEATGTNCAVPAIAYRPYPTWSNPDPIHISISSANDATNGTAVCKGPTAGPVALTANAKSNDTPPQALTGTVQLTCN